MGERIRLRPGAIIDCEDTGSFVDMLRYSDWVMDAVVAGTQPLYMRPRTLFTYEPVKTRGWGAYEWVGFWNYAVLGTATVLTFLLLHLGGLR